LIGPWLARNTGAGAASLVAVAAYCILLAAACATRFAVTAAAALTTVATVTDHAAYLAAARTLTDASTFCRTKW
jgi:hypothetical protein